MSHQIRLQLSSLMCDDVFLAGFRCGVPEEVSGSAMKKFRICWDVEDMIND